MPLVVVNRNPETVSDELLREILANLPAIVAGRLTCEDPGGELTVEDVEVWVRNSGPIDVNTKDLEIIIWANLFPDRLVNLGYRNSMMCFDLSQSAHIPIRIKGFIWTLLQNGSFTEFLI